jgi:hypothetical protein
MKNPLIPMSIRLFALMGLMPVLAADLKTFRDAYQKNSAELLQSCTPQFADLQQQYKKALETMKTTVQNQGDLVKTKAVIAEIDRFQKEKSQPATLNEDEQKEIKVYQVAYVKQYAKLETDLILKLGALTEKYELALDRLQKEMVKAGKLDEATARTGQRTTTWRLSRSWAKCGHGPAMLSTCRLRRSGSTPAGRARPGHIRGNAISTN